MTGLFLMVGLLLSCSIFQHSEGARNDECPEPDTTKFAEYYMDQYVVGTWARYYCNPGSRREAGVNNIIRCKKISGVAQWTSSSQPVCIALIPTGKRENSSMGPQIRTSTPTTVEGFLSGLSPTKKMKNSSIGPQINTSAPTAVEGFCGVPVPLKHATVKVTKYKVGQELKFKCLNESQACAPTIGIMMCENSTGVAVWSSLKPQGTDAVHLASGKQCPNPAILFLMAAGIMVFIL